MAQESEEDRVQEELGAAGGDEEEELIDEFAFLEDAGMIELASRHRQEIGMSPSAVTVLTREDVEASGATNLPDLLRLVPGMDVVVVSPSFTSVSSRLFWTNGNTFYQLLIDGRDCMQEMLGQVTWHAEPISLDDIERIEILRGPASSMYGASALAGVVSVTTRVVPEDTSASVRIDAGEAGLLQVGGRASTRFGGWGFSISGGADFSNSFNLPQVPDKWLWKLRSLVEYAWSDTERIRLDFGISQASGSLNSSIGGVDLSIFIRTLRLAYESKQLRGRLYWFNAPMEFTLKAPLEYMGLRLAEFVPVEGTQHTIDGEVQWTLPELHKNLLLIVGGGGRFSWIGSDNLLDGETFSDITSPDYHQPGMSYTEARAGAFVHSEFEATEWVTISGSLRFDYNTATNPFLSPRTAVVFRPVKGQYLRVAMARAFRKPAFIETQLHPMVSFPSDSPITGPGQDKFQEFMSRVLGNPNLDNEKLLSIEVGYLGQFFDNQLSVSVDMYYNQVRDLIGLNENIVAGEQGLPDLENSVLHSTNTEGDRDIHGLELTVRYNPSKQVSLLASWAYREVFDRTAGRVMDNTPKNLATVGGRFRTEWGLVGSLYLFSRSDLVDNDVESPQGALAPSLTMHLDHIMLFMGKLGYRWQTDDDVRIETGLKLFLPFSPFSGPLFQYYEDPGGESVHGRFYGGQQLRRILTAYLQGSF